MEPPLTSHSYIKKRVFLEWLGATSLLSQLIGSFLNLTFTRLDVVVNKACQQLQVPTKGNMQAMKRILRYLKGTMDYGLHFLQQSSLCLTGYYDLD